MSDAEQTNATQEPKQEDPNAPINIKVRVSCHGLPSCDFPPPVPRIPRDLYFCSCLISYREHGSLILLILIVYLRS